MTEYHPDLGRLRSSTVIKDSFSYVTSPSMPPKYHKITKDLDESSKPYQILKDFATLD
jgi:hypothetical protein